MKPDLLKDPNVLKPVLSGTDEDHLATEKSSFIDATVSKDSDYEFLKEGQHNLEITELQDI